jgi:predicted glycoside hydrolase/deacetylase ChbG (UPF0249 family)
MIPGNLIINADDFGLDPRVSEAIARCLDDGLINSFSVFPFRDGFHADLLRAILSRHPEVRVGAHLALVDGEMPEHPGHFRDVLSRYLTGRLTPSRVKAAWKAQIESLGRHLGGTRRIAHLDSHQHLHVLPGLWTAAKALQEEYRIPRVRVPYESLRRGLTYRFPFGLCMQALAFRRADRNVEAFIGFFSSMRFTVRGNHSALERVLLEPRRRFELMVHPALPAKEGEVSLALPSQEREMAELRLAGEFFDRASQA